MAYQVIWPAFAEAQLDALFEYYKQATASHDVASRIVSRLILAPDKLARHPGMGAREPLLQGRVIEYRFIVVFNYKNIYSVDDENKLIKIADVFDTRLNPEKINRVE